MNDNQTNNSNNNQINQTVSFNNSITNTPVKEETIETLSFDNKNKNTINTNKKIKTIIIIIFSLIAITSVFIVSKYIFQKDKIQTEEQNISISEIINTFPNINDSFYYTNFYDAKEGIINGYSYYKMSNITILNGKKDNYQIITNNDGTTNTYHITRAENNNSSDLNEVISSIYNDLLINESNPEKSIHKIAYNGKKQYKNNSYDMYIVELNVSEIAADTLQITTEISNEHPNIVLYINKQKKLCFYFPYGIWNASNTLNLNNYSEENADGEVEITYVDKNFFNDLTKNAINTTFDEYQKTIFENNNILPN